MPKKATGNAMTDSHGGASDLQAILAGIEAGLGQSAQSGGMIAQEAQAFGPNLDTANAQLDAVAADCMWPPSAQVTIPIIPGVYSQSFQIPCLLTYSEARAVFAVGIIIAGAQLLLTGVGILVAAEVLPAVLTVAGIRRLGGAGRSAAAEESAPAEAAPEGGLGPNPRDEPIAPPTRTASRHVREGRAPTEAEARKANQELAS